MRIYIPYATREGQTAKIADYSADVVRDHGYGADTVDIGLTKDGVPAGYDGVIVGSSIHMGKHDKHASEYMRHNRDALEQLPSAFFAVSLAAPRTVTRRRPRGTSRSSRPRPAGIRGGSRSSVVLCSTRRTGSSSGV